MLSARKARIRYRAHKLTSLLCVLFLLVSCLTGLPLIFHDEIDHPSSPSGSSRSAIEIPPVPLDRMVVTVRQQNPHMRTLFVTIDENESHVNVAMSARLTPHSPCRESLLSSMPMRKRRFRLLNLDRASWT